MIPTASRSASRSSACGVEALLRRADGRRRSDRDGLTVTLVAVGGVDLRAAPWYERRATRLETRDELMGMMIASSLSSRFPPMLFPKRRLTRSPPREHGRG